MTILSYLKNIAVWFGKNDSSLYMPLWKQKKIIDCFPNPASDYERSFFQYKCQRRLNGFFHSILLDIISLPLLVIFYFKKSSRLEKKKCDAVFITEKQNHQRLIPSCLRELYKKIENIDILNEYFDSYAKSFFWNIAKRHPFSWLYLLKCLIKIRIYRFIIINYNPSVIITCNEFSFTSSILTSFCNQCDVEHYDIMHGEKLFSIRDSFFHFNVTYVWDEFYINLFNELRADKKQFKIAIPEYLIIKDNVYNIKLDFTYYLQSESASELHAIHECLSVLKQRGFSIAVRPHPVYSNLVNVKKEFEKFIIEDNCAVGIEQSIMRTSNVISKYSTVLFQAFKCGKRVIIDDISNKRLFEQLSDLKYIMLSKKHTLLSELIKSQST